MKAVLLAGGLGTRLREETEFRPKPMVEIGGRPILWHIMKHLSTFGVTEFIIATGYKSDLIKEYFLNYEARNNDFTITLGNRNSLVFHEAHEEASWKVTVAYTGDTTNTGGRVFKIAKYLEDEPFLVTYGDGLANVNISELVSFHKNSGGVSTVTTVQPTSRFGVMDVSKNGQVDRFLEKPQLDSWINVGFFIMEPQALSYLDDESVLEDEPLTKMSTEGNLFAYRHSGFWQPMDTYREVKLLNDLWSDGNAPWKTW